MLVLQLLELQCVQIKLKLEKLSVALFFVPLIMKMACGVFIHYTYNIQCVTYQKNAIVIHAVLDGM